jgi:hypothetical protein
MIVIELLPPVELNGYPDSVSPRVNGQAASFAVGGIQLWLTPPSGPPFEGVDDVLKRLGQGGQVTVIHSPAVHLVTSWTRVAGHAVKQQHVRPSRPGLNGLPPSPDAGRKAGRQLIA